MRYATHVVVLEPGVQWKSWWSCLNLGGVRFYVVAYCRCLRSAARDKTEYNRRSSSKKNRHFEGGRTLSNRDMLRLFANLQTKGLHVRRIVRTPTLPSIQYIRPFSITSSNKMAEFRPDEAAFASLKDNVVVVSGKA